MIRIDDLLAKVSSYIPDPAIVGQVSRAYVYSATLHRNDFTPTGASTLQHALEVSSILADLKLDARCVVAGLVHDALEHSLAQPEALRHAIGEDAAHLVEEVSRLSRATFRGSEASRAQHMREMILASTRDLRVILLLLADRLQVLRAPQQLDPDTQKALARETLAIYAPIAHRLGIHYFKAELEDRAFEILEGNGFAELRAAVQDRLRQSQALLERVNPELQALLAAHGIPGQVLGRIKHLYSIHRKMQDKQLGLEQIQDLLATRIIVATPEDCYKALGLIHATYTPLPGRFKDYIALPKANGYRSLHTHVFFGKGAVLEVQIRTEAMHREAELGIAAHFVYKEGGGEDDPQLASVSWFRQLLENLEDGQDPGESLELLQRDLTPDEIFVFTPTGEVIKLPAGATPIDFAYAVHTRVGEHCTGARMDGRMISIRTPLKNGSVVEILTAQRQVPSEDWLKAAVSSRALSKIRAYLRVQEKEAAARLGRDTVARECKRVGQKLEDLLRQEAVQEWMRRNGLQSAEDLYAAEGLGKVSLHALLERLHPESAPPQATPLKRPRPPGKGPAADPAQMVRVAGMEGVAVRFARCCKPVYGDRLAGILTRGKGVSVHHRDCGNLARKLAADCRSVEVEWSDLPGTQRPVQLVIHAAAPLKRLVELISLLEEQEGTPITSGRINGRQGEYTQHLTVLVRDTRQIKRILQRLNAMEGIRAERSLESA